MNLQEARQKIPELAGLDDARAFNIIHSAYYPDMDRAALAKALNYAPDAPKAASRTWGDAVTDTGRGLASGVGGLVKGAGTLYGLTTGNMENGATELGDSVQQYWENGQSQQLKDKRTARQASIDATDGTLSKAYTAVKETLTDPALAMDTVATNAATMLPGMAVGRLAAGAKAAQGLSAASKFGPASVAAREAALKAAGSLGTKVAIGAGALQQGADVSQSVYEDAMKKSNEAWAQNPDFMAAFAKTDGSEKALHDTKHDFALMAARVTMPAATAISVGANMIPGADMLERALVGGGSKVAGKGGIAAVAKSMGKSALGEAAQETLEEGGGAFAGNVAQQRFTDPNQDLMEKVGENAGMGAAGGLLMGAGGGAFHGRAKKDTLDPSAAAAKLLADQQEVARKAAVGAVHAAAATPNSPIARAAAAANPLTPEEAWAKAQELDAQAELDEANGVEQVGPPAAPPAQQDGAMDALVAHQNADPTIQESLQVQPAPAFDAQAAQEQYRADTLAAQQAQDDELSAQAEAALATIDQRKQQTRPTNEVVSDGGYLYEGTQDGDVLNGLGKPFTIKMGALQEAKRQARDNGGDWTVAPVFDGYVARKNEASNVGVQDGTEPRSAEPAELAGDNANAGMGDRPVDRLPEGDNPLGADADPLGQSGEQAGGVDAGAVTPEKQAITDGYALDKTRDSGVRIFRKTDDAGRHMLAIDAAGELITSTSNFGEFTISDSYLDYDGPQAFVVSMDNKRGHLTAKNKESGQLIELSPRADKEFADGIPLAKVLETEFSDAGGIKPDGSKTPHTTTVKKSAPTAKQKNNVPEAKAAPVAQTLTEAKRRDYGDGHTGIEYSFGSGGTANVMVKPDGSAYLTDIVLGDSESDSRGKGQGTAAYIELGRQLAEQGVKLESTRWSKHKSAIAPSALRIWQKLEAAGLARQTGVEEGKVYDRFSSNEAEVKSIPVYEFIGNQSNNVQNTAPAASQTQAKPLAGQPIDKDWTAFHPESGTLDVPRDDMPQIKSEHRGAMVNFLKARGISSTQEEVPTESLKPTQREYSPEKVEKAKGFKGNDRSILVSSDGHVLDGHHQWVAKHEAGEPVKVIRLDAPIDALLSAVREFPSAETTVNSTTQEQASEKAAKAEQESAKPEAAAANSAVDDSGLEQPAAEQAGAGKAEVDLTTVEGVARAVQMKVAANRRKSREKSRKERDAKGYAPNSTPESEQADYEAEISAPPSDMQKQSAAAMLGTDPLPLIGMFVNGNFEASEDVFKAITGVKIRGLSAKDKKAALYQWAKWTPEQIDQAEGESQARAEEAADKRMQDDFNSAVTGAWLGLDRLKVNLKSGDTITGQDFILQSVAGGFDKAHSQKKGAAVIYGLTDGSRFTTLKAQEFTKFVKASITFGGLDKALAYVNPPKPQAPEGFVDRSIDTADSRKADPAPVEQAPQAEPAAPAPEADALGGFDPVAFDKERDDRIKASREAGNVHLDKVPPYVESMRGKQIYYAHDPKITGTIRTVDNRGTVYVNWNDAYSAEKELASPTQDGKKTVMQSGLGTSDLKDYVVGKPMAPAAEGSAPSKEPAPRPKNWDKNYGAASKIAEGLNIALRGANGKMKKVPELVAEIKALDVGGKPSPDGDGQHDELDSEMRAYEERATRIESTLANGGHVVGDQLRSNNGMGLMKLTPAELTRIPENKVREKPDPEKARVDTVKNQPKIDTSAEPVQKPAESGQVYAPQIEWTRTRNVDRMGIALKAGFKESVAESLSKRSWSSLDVVVQEKLAEAMAEPLIAAEQAAPSSEPAELSATADEVKPDAANKPAAAPSQDPSNTVKSPAIEAEPIDAEDRAVLDAAKAKIEELDSKIERHEALLDCLK